MTKVLDYQYVLGNLWQSQFYLEVLEKQNVKSKSKKSLWRGVTESLTDLISEFLMPLYIIWPICDSWKVENYYTCTIWSFLELDLIGPETQNTKGGGAWEVDNLTPSFLIALKFLTIDRARMTVKE